MTKHLEQNSKIYICFSMNMFQIYKFSVENSFWQIHVGMHTDSVYWIERTKYIIFLAANTFDLFMLKCIQFGLFVPISAITNNVNLIFLMQVNKPEVQNLHLKVRNSSCLSALHLSGPKGRNGTRRCVSILSVPSIYMYIWLKFLVYETQTVLNTIDHLMVPLYGWTRLLWLF